MSESIKLDPDNMKGAFLIPNGIIRHPSGKPALFIEHKQAFLDWCFKTGIMGQLDAMRPEDCEGLYFKWLEENPQLKP